MFKMNWSFKYLVSGIVWLFVLLIGFNPIYAATSFTNKSYTLEQVVVMSRHGIRTPLAGRGTIAEKITPHKWHQWSIPPGHLTFKGAINETAFGQYFQCYLEDEGLIPDNWIPGDGEVSFYANSFQRTIATARYFSAGMLPIADVQVEHKLGLDLPDPFFIQPIVYDTPRLYELGIAFPEKYFESSRAKSQKMLASFEKVTDFQHSEYAREKGIQHLSVDDFQISLKGAEKNRPSFSGSLRDAYKVSDVLIMQYYEVADNKQADWGTGLTDTEWKDIGDIMSSGLGIVCENPAIALRNTHNILDYIDKELQDSNKKFAFLCGHDTNLIMLMTVLGAGDYHVPETIVDKAPIGGKIVFEKRRGQDGELYINAYMIYQNDRQIRNCEILDLKNPPKRYQITLSSIERNADGLYRYSDFQNLLKDISAKYQYYTEK